jgi:hypothetical protein
MKCQLDIKLLRNDHDDDTKRNGDAILVTETRLNNSVHLAVLSSNYLGLGT